MTTVSVVGVNELDAIGQLAGHYRQMTVVVCDMPLICYHTFDSARSGIEIPLDTPRMSRKYYKKINGIHQMLLTERPV